MEDIKTANELLVSFRKPLFCKKCQTDYSDIVTDNGYYAIHCNCGNLVDGWAGGCQDRTFPQGAFLQVWKYFWFGIDSYIPPEIRKQIIANEQTMHLLPLEQDPKARKPMVQSKVKLK